jgi:hypothetical protein
MADTEEIVVKRPKTVNVPDSVVYSSSLLSILDNITAEMSAIMSQQLSSTAVQIGNHVQASEDRLTAQHQVLEQQFLVERIRTAQIEAEQNKIKEDMGNLQAAIAVAESAPADNLERSVPNQPARLVDPSIIRISAACLVSLESVTFVLESWLAESGFQPAAYELQGGNLSRLFSFQFKGENGIASRKARSAISSLKNSGVWKQLAIKRPDGSFLSRRTSKHHCQAERGNGPFVHPWPPIPSLLILRGQEGIFSLVGMATFRRPRVQ